MAQMAPQRLPRLPRPPCEALKQLSSEDCNFVSTPPGEILEPEVRAVAKNRQEGFRYPAAWSQFAQRGLFKIPLTAMVSHREHLCCDVLEWSFDVTFTLCQAGNGGRALGFPANEAAASSRM